MDTSQIYKGITDLLVLAVLRRGESYGYDILKKLRLAGIEALSDASVYGTLKRLDDQGHLYSRLVESDSGPARRYYRTTEAGMEALASGVEYLDFIGEALRDLLERGSRAEEESGD